MLIADNNRAVLCGFRSSRIRHQTPRILSRMQNSENFQFIAPELIENDVDDSTASKKTTNHVRESNQQTDVYAMGMTFLELGTLRLPFGATSALQVARWVQANKRPPRPNPIGWYWGKNADWIWNLISAMWQHEPSSRPTLAKTREVLAKQAALSNP